MSSAARNSASGIASDFGASGDAPFLDSDFGAPGAPAAEPVASVAFTLSMRARAASGLRAFALSRSDFATGSASPVRALSIFAPFVASSASCARFSEAAFFAFRSVTAAVRAVISASFLPTDSLSFATSASYTLIDAA